MPVPASRLAYHAGEAECMLNNEPIPEPALAQLSLLAAADLQDSLMVATNDLDRLQRLLTDATETLMSHFYGASDHIKHLSRLAAQHPELPKQRLHEIGRASCRERV